MTSDFMFVDEPFCRGCGTELIHPQNPQGLDFEQCQDLCPLCDEEKIIQIKNKQFIKLKEPIQKKDAIESESYVDKIFVMDFMKSQSGMRTINFYRDQNHDKIKQIPKKQISKSKRIKRSKFQTSDRQTAIQIIVGVITFICTPVLTGLIYIELFNLSGYLLGLLFLISFIIFPLITVSITKKIQSRRDSLYITLPYKKR